MASNLDKTNELLDFIHAKVHSVTEALFSFGLYMKKIVPVWRVNCRLPFFCHLLSGGRKIRFSLFPALIKNATWNNAIFKFVKQLKWQHLRRFCFVESWNKLNNISFYVPAKFYHITNDNHSIYKDPHIMFSWFFQLYDLYACFFVVVVVFLQDIYYANNKELIKKKLLTKFQTTLITEG